MPDTQLSVSAHAEFEELYRRHGGRVLAYVLHRASPDVADDVVADVFLVAWRKLGGRVWSHQEVVPPPS